MGSFRPKSLRPSPRDLRQRLTRVTSITVGQVGVWTFGRYTSVGEESKKRLPPSLSVALNKFQRVGVSLFRFGVRV